MDTAKGYFIVIIQGFSSMEDAIQECEYQGEGTYTIVEMTYSYDTENYAAGSPALTNVVSYTVDTGGDLH